MRTCSQSCRQQEQQALQKQTAPVRQRFHQVQLIRQKLEHWNQQRSTPAAARVQPVTHITELAAAARIPAVVSLAVAAAVGAMEACSPQPGLE